MEPIDSQIRSSTVLAFQYDHHDLGYYLLITVKINLGLKQLSIA